mmetsp:Transcript_6801/g.17347  ORF Transcript_6801/g.17347 Transcript_6801/m.17347 type:complete len:239 (-) Transcript_6801:79-795(-)
MPASQRTTGRSTQTAVPARTPDAQTARPSATRDTSLVAAMESAALARGATHWIRPSPLAADLADDPFHAILQAIAGRRAARLDRPGAVLDLVHVERVGDLVRRSRLEQVLLVGEDQEGHAAQLLMDQQFLEFQAALLKAAFVRAVDDIHKSIGRLEVVGPVRPDGLLATDVPNVQLEPLMHQALDVEALRGHDMRDVLLRKLLQDRRLARVVEAKHEDAGLLIVLLHRLQDLEQPHCF